MISWLDVREISGILLPRGDVDGGLCMLTVYTDDSGTHDGSALVVMACFIAPEEIWHPFEAAWKALSFSFRLMASPHCNNSIWSIVSIDTANSLDILTLNVTPRNKGVP